MIKFQKRKKILVVTSDYYEDIYKNLKVSAWDCIDDWGGDPIETIVPGALEIPQLINLHFNDKIRVYDGVIALGCVIKGETYHFEIVSNESNRGLMDVALKYSIPVGNGIITAYNYDQALERSLNKGKEAVNACFELIRFRNSLININNKNVEQD